MSQGNVGCCGALTQWLWSPFSAVVTFQKQFVDDVADTVKRRTEHFSRQARELQERAVQLHLDSLEAKYLCCVCGKSGESREADGQDGQAFSTVSMPGRNNIERAMLERNRGGKNTAANRYAGGGGGGGSGQQGASAATASPLHAANYYDDDDEEEEDVDVDVDCSEGTAARHSTTTVDFYSEAETRQRAREERQQLEETHVRDDPALDPSLVPAVEVSRMMSKVRQTVLNKSARSKHTQAAADRRDHGLAMIEDADIELFSRFFQRPVRGYLCEECHSSARKRLSALTIQIQSLLFRAKHPLLRKAPDEEVRMLAAADQLSDDVVSSVNDIKRRWRQQMAVAAAGGGGGHRHTVGDDSGATFPSNNDNNNNRDKDFAKVKAKLLSTHAPSECAGSAAPAAGQMATLTDSVILTLRTLVKCGVCQRRSCCFFMRVNVLFICQFCCARDRFYRDHAVCVNDEPKTLDTVRLLTDLCGYHERVYRQQELRQLPQTELRVAPTDMFGMQESLFRCQPEALRQQQQQQPLLSYKAKEEDDVHGDGEDEIRCAAVEAKPHFSLPAERAQRNPRDVAANTALSLFEGTQLVRGEDLFTTADLTNTTTTTTTTDAAAAGNGYSISATTHSNGNHDALDHFLQ